MEWINIVIAGAAGLLGSVGGVMGYLRYQAKHPVEVKEAEVRIQAAKIENEDHIIERYRSELDHMEANRKKLIERMEILEERQRKQVESHSIQEADCGQKIAKLNRQIQELTDKIDRAQSVCPEGCFADKIRKP